MPTLESILRCLDRELSPKGPLVAEVEDLVADEYQKAFDSRGASLRGSTWDMAQFPEADLIETGDFRESFRPGSAGWENRSRRTGPLSLQIEIANVHRKKERGMFLPIIALWQHWPPASLDMRGPEASGFISPTGMARVRAAIEARLTRCFREGA